MALQTIPGEGLWIPGPERIAIAPTIGSVLIDASTEIISMNGRFWNKDRATKTIESVGILLGSVTAGGTPATFRVSLQDTSLTTGPFAQPDGVVDQSWTAATNTLSSNAWTSNNLSAGRSVAFGELLSVVADFSAFTSGDAVNLRFLQRSVAASPQSPSITHFTGSWTVNNNVLPNVILGCSDGTFGTLFGGWPLSDIGTTVFNSGSAADEWCLEFQLPAPVKTDGCWMIGSTSGGTSDVDFVLYDGTTAMTNGTISFDGNTLVNSTTRFMYGAFGAEISLSANTTYRLAMKPTTANNVTIAWFDVAAAGHFQCHAFGTSGKINSRVDGGAWGTATDTRRPFGGLSISAIDDGAGGGSGGVIGGPSKRGGKQ